MRIKILDNFTWYKTQAKCYRSNFFNAFCILKHHRLLFINSLITTSHNIMSNICLESYFSGGENMNPFSYCSFFSPYSYVLFQLNFSFIVLFLTSYKTIPMYCFLSACSQPKLLVCFALWPRTNQIWYTYQLYSRLYSQLVYPWSLSIWLPWYTFIQYMSSFGLITMIHDIANMKTIPETW